MMMKIDDDDDDDDGYNDEDGGSYLNLTESKVFLLLPVISDVNKLAPEREIFELLEMKMTVTMTEGSSGKQPCCKITRNESWSGMKLTTNLWPSPSLQRKTATASSNSPLQVAHGLYNALFPCEQMWNNEVNTIFMDATDAHLLCCE